MGITFGLNFKSISDGDVSRCVPESGYKPFPRKACKTPGKIVAEMIALPRSCHAGPRPTDAYWWTDCQFLPHDDSCLVMTCGSYIPRSGGAWSPSHRLPVGRILKVWLNDGNRMTGEVFKGSYMCGFPKLQTHPSGKYIGYIGRDAVKITTLNHEDVYNKFKDLRNCNYRFCAFSPDGKSFAILQTSGRRIELLVSATNRGTAFSDNCVDLTKLLPEFSWRTYNEHMECKWSMDSQYIAVCSSIQYLFIMSRSLDLVVDVVGDILPADVYPSWSGTFDYDPQFCNEVLAVGTNDRCVYVVNVVTKEVVMQTEALSKDAIDCVKYNFSGSTLAVATRDFNVSLLSSYNLEMVFSVDMKSVCLDIVNTHVSFPSVMRLGFSTRSEHLATSTCDGRVRVWQLPPVGISLFSLCKWEILRHVPPHQLNLLPLPPKLKTTLLPLSVL